MCLETTITTSELEHVFWPVPCPARNIHFSPFHPLLTTSRAARLCSYPDDCNNGVPTTCNKRCADRWLHFVDQCSDWLSLTKQFPHFKPFTKQCEHAVSCRNLRVPRRVRGRDEARDCAAHCSRCAAATELRPLGCLQKFGVYTPNSQTGRCSMPKYRAMLAAVNATCCKRASNLLTTESCDVGKQNFPKWCSSACSSEFGAFFVWPHPLLPSVRMSAV